MNLLPEVVPTGNLVTLLLPYVGADQDEFVHEVQTVVSDLIHKPSDMVWSVLRDVDPTRLTEGGSTVLLTSATVSGEISQISDGLRNVVSRYTTGPIFWTFGPALVALQNVSGMVLGE